MDVKRTQIVLGSRSPRRLELLRQIIPAERIEVVPPRSADEQDFRGALDWEAVSKRLLEIARLKCADVLEQLRSEQPSRLDTVAAVIAADTVIVGLSGHGSTVVLGQPPTTANWKDVVRQWFVAYYLGRTHFAASALVVATPEGKHVERVVRTDVTFRADARKLLDWYLDTGEPVGKAGGYALQGAGSLFVEQLTGSISNVVGLPLEAVVECLQELGIPLTSAGCHAFVGPPT